MNEQFLLAIRRVGSHCQELAVADPQAFGDLVRRELLLFCSLPVEDLTVTGLAIERLYIRCMPPSEDDSSSSLQLSADERLAVRLQLEGFLQEFRQLEEGMSARKRARHQQQQQQQVVVAKTAAAATKFKSFSRHDTDYYGPYNSGTATNTRGTVGSVGPSSASASSQHPSSLSVTREDVLRLKGSPDIPPNHLQYLKWTNHGPRARICCDLCRVNLTIDSVPNHVQGRKHSNNYEQEQRRLTGRGYVQQQQPPASTSSWRKDPSTQWNTSLQQLQQLAVPDPHHAQRFVVPNHVAITTTLNDRPTFPERFYKQQTTPTASVDATTTATTPATKVSLPVTAPADYSPGVPTPSPQRLDETNPIMSFPADPLPTTTALPEEPQIMQQKDPPIETKTTLMMTATTTATTTTRPSLSSSSSLLLPDNVSLANNTVIPNLETLERIDEAVTEIKLQPDPIPINSNNGTTQYGRGLRARPSTTVRFQKRYWDDAVRRFFKARWAKWEPYWELLTILGESVAAPVRSTSPHYGMLHTATEVSFRVVRTTVGKEYFKPIRNELLGKTSNLQPENGSLELILCMMPVESDSTRADGHLWPKGTFLQFNNLPIVLKQRYHERVSKKWTGNCEFLRLAPIIHKPDQTQIVSLATADRGAFMMAVLLCRYRGKLQLYQMIAQPETTPQRLSVVDGLAKVKTMIHDVSADDELTVRLTCPLTKRVLHVPVRGKTCSHFQCFELQSFIESNTVVGHNRWRCSVCEQRIALSDVEICAFTQSILAGATAERNLVKIGPTGDYRIIEEDARSTNVIRVHSPSEIVEIL